MPETPACHEFEADLSALLDDELAPARAAELRAHIGACAGCSERLARLARVDAALAGAPAPKVSASLRPRLEARLGSERAPPAGPAPKARAKGAPRRALDWKDAGMLVATAAGLGLFYLVFVREPAPPPLDLQSVPEEELGLALEIETADDLDVIGNLEVLELLLASEAG